MKTTVTFLDPLRVKVETASGDTYILGFASDMNYQIEQQWDSFYSKKTAELFDKYYDGKEDSIWGPILREMSNYRLNGFSWIIIDRNKERIRIGQRIKEIRKEFGMDAKELAQKVGIDASTLSRIEQGRFSVGSDTLSKIASIFKMRLDFVQRIIIVLCFIGGFNA